MNLMFQPQFEPMIVSGRKVHTIRPKRKVPLRPGQPLSLRVWTSKPYRSPQREFHASTVKKVSPIVVTHLTALLDGVQLVGEEREGLAYHDGFESWQKMADWFASTHGLPFTGELIYWKP